MKPCFCFVSRSQRRGYALPNAIYTDAVAEDGTLLTSAGGWALGGGNKVGGGVGGLPWPGALFVRRLTSFPFVQFAYAATLVLSTVQQLCGGSSAGACAAAVEWLTA